MHNDTYIPYGRHFLNDDDIKAVISALKSEYLTTGPFVQKFENALVKVSGSRYVVVFSSGTAALHAAYFVAGLKKDKEVITSPITFAATANAALYLGGKPVFIDLANNSFNIDVSLIKNAINSSTKIIAPVDMAGLPVDIDPIMEIAAEHELTVVEDASHALGASYKGRPVGSTADMTVFSFHPVKHITTGEGGAVATNDKGFYEKLIMFRSHGITRNPHKLIDKNIGPWHQEMHFLGFNYRLSDIQCALGLSQLKKIEYFLSRRKEIVAAYNEAFSGIDQIELPPEKGNTDPAWHLYIIRLLRDFDKKRFVDELSKKGIGTQVHYMPVYRHPYYNSLCEKNYNPALYPNAEKYYRQALSIPLYPSMTDQQVRRVIEGIINLLEKYHD